MAERGSLDDIVIRFKALPDSVPVANRVRALLKYALRVCRLKNEGISGPPDERQQAGDPNPSAIGPDAADAG